MKKNICRSLIATIAILLLSFLTACDVQKEPEPAPITTDEPPVSTEDLSGLIGTEYTAGYKVLGCTPFSAESEDAAVVEARVFDRELTLTATGSGSTVVTVRNTYGEDFELSVVCSAADGITVSGEYTPDENSVNVRDFKTTDADAATYIQAAIDSLPNGGTVYIPRGTYTISQIQLKEGIHLKLEGLLKDYTKEYAKSGAMSALSRGDFAVLRAAGGVDMFINHTRHDYGRTGCSNFSITGGMLDMRGTTRCFIWCCADNVLLQNVVLKDCPNNHAIQVTGCSNVRILDCMFAGYNYTGNNTTAEVIQVESTHPGAIGSGENTASKFDAGEFFLSSNVEISGCYFGKSSEYDAPTFAIGHHGQTYASAVTGLKITNCVFDNPRCAAIRYPAYSDVIISGNTFISDRDNNLSSEASPAMISLILKDNNVSITTKTSSGASVTAYYAKKYACIGSINTTIENNEFVFGEKTKMKQAISAVSNYYRADVMYETNDLFVNWYTETPKRSRGYKLVQNRITDLKITNNKITVDAGYSGNGQFFVFQHIYGLICENNTVEGQSYSVSATVDGVTIPYAKTANCKYGDSYKRKILITANKSANSDIVIAGDNGATLSCTSSSDTILTIKTDGGYAELSVDKNGAVVITPVPDEGKSFVGYEVTSGSLKQNGDKYEFGATLTTIELKFN